METKVCSMCRLDLPASEYHRHKSGSQAGRLLSRCKACGRIATNARRERLKAARRCIMCAEPVGLERSGKANCKKCMNLLRGYTEARAGEPCAFCGEKPRSRYKNSCNDCHKNIAHRRRRSQRLQVLEAYGNRCACCGETEEKFLSVDHINNDGNEHRKEIGTYVYGWIITNNFPDTLQILCHNCNFGKQLNGGVCPHQAKAA